MLFPPFCFLVFGALGAFFFFCFMILGRGPAVASGPVYINGLYAVTPSYPDPYAPKKSSSSSAPVPYLEVYCVLGLGVSQLPESIVYGVGYDGCFLDFFPPCGLTYTSTIGYVN